MDSQLRKNELGFWEVIDKPSPEELRKYYAERYFQEARGSFEIGYTPEELDYFHFRWEVKKNIIERIRGDKKGSMLDVGCGEGHNIAFFREIGWTVRGLDFSSYGVKSQHPDCLDFLVTGDINELLEEEQIQGNSYDVIWLQNVLEHVVDPLKLFKDISSLVADDGLAIITVPNDFSITQLSAKKHNHIDSDFWVVLPDHLCYFSSKSLVDTSIQMGWVVREMISDFPIDWFLFHQGSNYVKNKELGKSAHFARVQIERSLQQNDPNDIIKFWSGLAQVGVGRNLTIFLQKKVEDVRDQVKDVDDFSAAYRKYKCLPREKIAIGNYSIETVQDSDIESIRCWRNSQMDVLRQSTPISVEEQTKYYQTVIWPSMNEPNPKNILLRYLMDEKLIGYGGLVNIAWGHQRAEVSFLLNPSLAAEMDTYANCYSNFLSLLKELSFEDLGFKRLFTETYAIRKHHISILESNGFRVEGVLKNHIHIDGDPVDSIIHGFLSSYNE